MSKNNSSEMKQQRYKDDTAQIVDKVIDQCNHNSLTKGENVGDELIMIKVLFFARARDLTGLSETFVEVSSGGAVKDIINKLLAKFPKLVEIYNSMVVALNEEYASESAILKNNDELAIIPPISGG